MVIWRGIVWGIAATAWLLIWVSLALALLLPWWEHTGLVGLDWSALLSAWALPPLPPTMVAAALQLLAAVAAGGIMVALIVRLLGQDDLVTAVLRWTLGALRPSLPAWVLMGLVAATLAIFLPRDWWTGMLLSMAASIYLYFSCHRPAVVASERGRGWWRAALAPFPVLVMVVALWLADLSAEFALGLFHDRFAWPLLLTAALAWPIAIACGAAASLALVRRLDWRTLPRALSALDHCVAVRAVVDLELRALLIGLLVAVPLIIGMGLTWFVLPQMEASLDSLGQALPPSLETWVLLARGMVGGWWMLLTPAFLAFYYLAQARLIWLLSAGDRQLQEARAWATPSPAESASA
ncbi:MAG: hypothetical protein KDI71_13410 [Xanthomonadales bacterium]|nr:hypothetical protein [Xanthomonadales bacterium]